MALREAYSQHAHIHTYMVTVFHAYCAVLSSRLFDYFEQTEESTQTNSSNSTSQAAQNTVSVVGAQENEEYTPQTTFDTSAGQSKKDMMSALLNVHNTAIATSPHEDEAASGSESESSRTSGPIVPSSAVSQQKMGDESQSESESDYDSESSQTSGPITGVCASSQQLSDEEEESESESSESESFKSESESSQTSGQSVSFSALPLLKLRGECKKRGLQQYGDKGGVFLCTCVCLCMGVGMCVRAVLETYVGRTYTTHRNMHAPKHRGLVTCTHGCYHVLSATNRLEFANKCAHRCPDSMHGCFFHGSSTPHISPCSCHLCLCQQRYHHT